MIEIPVVKRLEPYFKVAEDEAHKSPCLRRQYGALVCYPNENDSSLWYQTSHNKRVSTCCGGNTCVRDTMRTRHGGSVEIGGEIHAETSLLIQIGMPFTLKYFILVGFEKGHELLGENVYPCHSCAMSIKFAGYKYIYIRDKKRNIIPVSISEVINQRISEWEPVD